MHALVIADGDPPDIPTMDVRWPGWRDGVRFVVAADGGALSAIAAGLHVDVVVGDGDSLGEAGLARVAAAGIPIERSPVDKDESDTELAVLACLARGADAVTVIGAFGGRLDHTLANVWLLALPALAGREARLLDAHARVRLIRAPASDGGAVRTSLHGRPGDLVTLLPMSADAVGITTAGLRYPLRDEPLHPGPARGLSNVRVDGDASVTVRAGLLLVLESAPEPPPAEPAAQL
jgi:thiamine pyrophosphokinase